MKSSPAPAPAPGAAETKPGAAATTPGAAATVPAPAAGGVRKVPIEVVEKGYSPDRIPGKPGEKLSLVFTLPEQQPLVVVVDPACSALIAGDRARSYTTLNPLPVFDALYADQPTTP